MRKYRIFQARETGPKAEQAPQSYCETKEKHQAQFTALGQQEINRMPSRACTPREKLRLALV